jgi:hypothetical protein
MYVWKLSRQHNSIKSLQANSSSILKMEGELVPETLENFYTLKQLTALEDILLNITCTINNDYRTVATLYTLETLFASGI